MSGVFFFRTVPGVMEHYGCSQETAQRYMDLRDEGYPMHQARVMAGLADPPDDEPLPREAADNASPRSDETES